ncbi:enoyl-CoA hydratase/isomerase family protein [Flectobacillus longus]|uniref:enoyl-CoA hydratase/isomerase family protein n=1 Tax=Flectobacillus longus TaxID=2984207 RepID=UPI0024B6ABCD|nr:enoyl-CoA hydratase-related protein [Flectobacillus longus]MDI9880799.1 enoyl-CoA hydratase-related protein [Flectobacillus longus]
MFELLKYEVKNAIAFITLNRPEVYHALNPALIQEITKAVNTASEDTIVRVIVLTAEGTKAFCSGADLKEGLGDIKLPSESLRKNYNPMVLAMRNSPKPIIGGLNGIAAGAGCSLALACDILIASENAAMSEIFVSIGLIIDAGSSYFLPRIVGSQRAFELCSTGRRLSAQECLDLGLVSKVVPADEFRAILEGVAQQYAKAPTKAIGLIKKVLNQSSHSSLEQMLELEAIHQDQAVQSHDFIEGVSAFLQKRPANFQGK